MDGKYGSYNSEEICRVLHDVKRVMGRGTKWAIFIDNASYHVSNETMDCCIDLDIAVIYNASHRPDLNGIERFWATAKREYKKRLTRL